MYAASVLSAVQNSVCIYHDFAAQVNHLIARCVAVRKSHVDRAVYTVGKLAHDRFLLISAVAQAPEDHS